VIEHYRSPRFDILKNGYKPVLLFDRLNLVKQTQTITSVWSDDYPYQVHMLADELETAEH
jgi:hypothetical protein